MDVADASSLVEKIALLERRVGAATGYRNLDPRPLDLRDIVQIQAAAGWIRDFVQLSDLTFVVGFAKQQEGVLGNIELEYGQDGVFIEIARESMEFPELVVAVLAHEICHKYLHRHGLYCSSPATTKEEEVLTDVAAVFLGLGKLMLNGCEAQKTRDEILCDGTRRSTTTTQRAGYLDPAQFAFAYRFVCAMRKVPGVEMRRGLSESALLRLLNCEESFEGWFDKRCHTDDFLPHCVGSLDSAIHGAQLEVAFIDRYLLYLQRGCIGPVEAWSRRLHRKLHDARRIARHAEVTPEYDPCLAYIRAVQLNQTAAEVVRLRREEKSMQKVLQRIEDIVASASAPFCHPSTDMFTETICKNCETKIHLPEMARNVTVVCPNPSCRYKFIATTSSWTQVDTTLRTFLSSLVKKLRGS
jgi:hypothetical protein